MSPPASLVQSIRVGSKNGATHLNLEKDPIHHCVSSDFVIVDIRFLHPPHAPRSSSSYLDAASTPHSPSELRREVWGWRVVYTPPTPPHLRHPVLVEVGRTIEPEARAVLADGSKMEEEPSRRRGDDC
jgi:hypothetical protein